MSDPYIGEIRLFGFGRIPIDWAPCNGQLIDINSYQALYSLIGTTYGGDGTQWFALPDLRGRLPIHHGAGPGLPTHAIGEKAESEQVTLAATQLPSHSHALLSTSNVATTATPGPSTQFGTDNLPSPQGNLYAPAGNATGYEVMATSILAEGGGRPHDNVMPTLVGNYCISLYGIYPSPG